MEDQPTEAFSSGSAPGAGSRPIESAKPGGPAGSSGPADSHEFPVQPGPAESVGLAGPSESPVQPGLAGSSESSVQPVPAGSPAPGGSGESPVRPGLRLDGGDDDAGTGPAGSAVDPTEAAGPDSGDVSAVRSREPEGVPMAGPEYPEEADDWAWETRWADEERRAREQDSDETQVIVAPTDDRPHMIPGFDRYDESPTDPDLGDEDDTVFVRTRAAETTLLTPGVRPKPAPSRSAPADAGEPPPGGELPFGGEPPPGGEPTAFISPGGEPTAFISPGAGSAAGSEPADEPSGPTSPVGGWRSDGVTEGEPTTFLAYGGDAAAGPTGEEPTRRLSAGGPVPDPANADGDETTTFLSRGDEPTAVLPGSEEPTTSIITRGPDVGDEPTVVRGTGTGSAVVIDEDDGERTQLVPLPVAEAEADESAAAGADRLDGVQPGVEPAESPRGSSGESPSARDRTGSRNEEPTAEGPRPV
ncbi:hypothetical protein [Actinoplanes xinjiangensis]|uniref:hypothetical protein n=1 Tax=Actinoplanes xinjiangensis TaxID=512350 RepID=UPI00343DCE27